MTVGELKKVLKQIDNDLPVLIEVKKYHEENNKLYPVPERYSVRKIVPKDIFCGKGVSYPCCVLESP